MNNYDVRDECYLMVRFNLLQSSLTLSYLHSKYYEDLVRARRIRFRTFVDETGPHFDRSLGLNSR